MICLYATFGLLQLIFQPPPPFKFKRSLNVPILFTSTGTPHDHASLITWQYVSGVMENTPMK